MPGAGDSTRPIDRLHRHTDQERREPTRALIGYARVSTDDQNCAAQVYELQRAGCTEIVQEQASGADRRRPALARILATIGAGDTLVIVRLDRLARSTRHLLDVVDDLKKKRAGLRSLHDPIDTTSPSGAFTLLILAGVAELERAMIIERTRAGVAAAARAGRMPGHPGLRRGDPETTRELARHRRRAHLVRATRSLRDWTRAIDAQRPDAWERIATRIAEAGGPPWSGERLRRTVARLRAAGLWPIEPAE